MSLKSRCALAGLASWVICYLAAAFILLETNPFMWSENARFVFVSMGVMCTWVSAGLPYVLYRKSNA